MEHQVVFPPCTKFNSNLNPIVLSQKLHVIGIAFVVVILDVQVLFLELLVKGSIAFRQAVIDVVWQNHMPVFVRIVTILGTVYNL